jgi:hypothetical protein
MFISFLFFFIIIIIIIIITIYSTDPYIWLFPVKILIKYYILFYNYGL